MKKIIIILIALLYVSVLFGQKINDNSSTKTDDTPKKTTESDFNIDYFIIGGSLGLGPIVSSNLVGSGFIGESTLDFMIQHNHHRYGFGITNTLMGTPENLAVLLFTLGKDNVNLHKGYFIYEWTLFKRSPINIGGGTKVGAFTVGNIPDTTKTTFFWSVGPYVELGSPKFYLYVKPEFGYNSYNIGSWKKDLYVVGNIGLRWKMPTEEEKKRREDKRKKRKK